MDSYRKFERNCVWAAIFGASLAVVVHMAGCYSPTNKPGPAPEPVPVFDDPIAEASAKAFDRYRTGMAAKWREAANRAGEFKGHADARDWFREQSEAVHKAAFSGYVKAIDEALRPQEESEAHPFDPEAFAKAYNAAADGAEKK